MMVEILLEEVCMSRCDYHAYVFLTSSICTCDLLFFFTLGIMHKKLIFIYIIIPDVGGGVFNCPCYVFYLHYTRAEAIKQLFV